MQASASTDLSEEAGALLSRAVFNPGPPPLRLPANLSDAEFAGLSELIGCGAVTAHMEADRTLVFLTRLGRALPLYAPRRRADPVQS